MILTLNGRFLYESQIYLSILDVRKIGHLNIKTKMFDIEARVLIGWYSLAGQSERVRQSSFYVKVAYLLYGEYNYDVYNIAPCKKLNIKPPEH